MFKSTLDKRKQTGYRENPTVIKPVIDKVSDEITKPHRNILMDILKRTDSSTFSEWKTLNNYFSSKYKDFYKQSSKELLLAPRVTTLESRVPLSIIYFNISKNLHKEFKPKFEFKKSKTVKMLQRMEKAERHIQEEISKRTEVKNEHVESKPFVHEEKEMDGDQSKLKKIDNQNNIPMVSLGLNRVKSAHLALATDKLLSNSISISAFRIQSSKNGYQNINPSTFYERGQSYVYDKSINTATQATEDDRQRLPSSYCLKGSRVRLLSAEPSIFSIKHNNKGESMHRLSRVQSGLHMTAEKKNGLDGNRKGSSMKPRINSAIGPQPVVYGRFGNQITKKGGSNRPTTAFVASN